MGVKCLLVAGLILPLVLTILPTQDENYLNSVSWGRDQSDILDFQDFQWVTSPVNKCGKSDNKHGDSDGKLYLLVLVNSTPENFKQRNLIRETWGSVRKFRGWRVRVLFLLGQAVGSKKDEWVGNSVLKSRSLHHHQSFFKSSSIASTSFEAESTNKLIALESHLHTDIVQGNFLDTDRNSTYKHVMGYKWVQENCHENPPKFVLKTDDNVFVEMYHLLNFVSAVYGPNPGPSLVCDVVPAGTVPRKRGGHTGFLKQELYPKYCSGSAYLITPSLMSKFLKATMEVSPLWQDDYMYKHHNNHNDNDGDVYIDTNVYMTGLVRDHLNVSPFYLNLRYTYELDRANRWLRNNNNIPLPFIFVVNSNESYNSDWPQTARLLWEKSEEVHHQRRRPKK